jgi:hypothetical protein
VEAKLHEKVLFSFLFANKNNNAIELFELIEDVAPTRIKKAYDLMKKMKIDEGVGKEEGVLYLRSFIADRLLLAKLVFGSEKVSDKKTLVTWVARWLLYGSNFKNARPMAFASEVLAFASESHFELAQRFVDFLRSLEALSFEMGDYFFSKEMKMEQESFKEYAYQKFKMVELLAQKPRAREFYLLGALARYVMDWQYVNGAESLKKYLDSIGSVNMANKDRVFRKITEGAKKYGVGSLLYDELLELYVKVVEELNSKDTISMDEANVAFVMGAVDLKEWKKTKGVE